MVSRLEPKHWALIASFLGSTALVIAGLDHWGDFFKPAVVGGLLGQLSTLMTAVFVGAPPNPNLTDVSNPGRRDTDISLGSVSESARSKLP